MTSDHQKCSHWINLLKTSIRSLYHSPMIFYDFFFTCIQDKRVTLYIRKRKYIFLLHFYPFCCKPKRMQSCWMNYKRTFFIPILLLLLLILFHNCGRKENELKTGLSFAFFFSFFFIIFFYIVRLSVFIVLVSRTNYSYKLDANENAINSFKKNVYNNISLSLNELPLFIAHCLAKCWVTIHHNIPIKCISLTNDNYYTWRCHLLDTTAKFFSH